MDGSWKVNPVTKPSRAGYRIRIILQTADIQAAGIDLGLLEVLEREHDMDVVSHLGPDLLGDDWDPRVAAANLTADPDRQLSETLLDQRVMAGVGNVYCNELCFVTGHLSTAPVSAVADPLRMVQRARDMLWLNRSRWNRTTTGNTRHGQELWVYGRGGLPCRRCGTPIESDSGGDRVRYWCPVCQT
jgi:endonuclease-8